MTVKELQKKLDAFNSDMRVILSEGDTSTKSNVSELEIIKVRQADWDDDLYLEHKKGEKCLLIW